MDVVVGVSWCNSTEMTVKAGVCVCVCVCVCARHEANMVHLCGQETHILLS